MRFAIFILLLLCLNSLAQQSPADSMIKLNAELEGKQKVDNLINLGRHFFIQQDTHSRIYTLEAMQLSKEFSFEEGIGKAALFHALSYDPSNMDSAMKYYQLSSEILTGLNHPWAGFGYSNCAQIFRNRGWYPEALECYSKALESYELANDTVQVAKVTSSLGFLYDRMGNHQEAISWQKKALGILKGRNDPARKGLIFGRIGISFDEMGIYDSAHFYNKKAIEIFKAIHDNYYLAQWYSNIANTYIKQNRYKQAEIYLEKALKLAEIDLERIMIYNNLSKVFIESGRFKEAESYLQKAIIIAQKTDQRGFLAESFFRMHELRKKQGDFDGALDYYVKYNTLDDSVINVEKTEQIARMKVKFETEQKEKELLLERNEKERLAKEKALAYAAISRRDQWITGISSVGAVSILFLLVIFQRNKRKAQAEKDAAIIQEKEASLDAVIMAQEEERKRIAKDLHDGIVQQIAGTILGWRKICEKEKADKSEELKLLKGLEDSSNELRQISHRMMPKALSEFGVIDAIDDMLGNTLGIAGIQYEFEHFGLKGRLSEKVELTLFRVTQELVNNILKHSKADEVSVQLYKSGKEIILMVEDNGIGIPEKFEKKGIGLMNIESRTQAANGKVNIVPGPEGGTVVSIKIPIESA